MNKCVFLDRDGVINKDYSDYTYTLEKFIILDGVEEALLNLKDNGYLLIIITNQAGIARGIYTIGQMQQCHDYLQDRVGGIIDAIYYAPFHPQVSESLSRKPGSLMFEKAISRFNVDVTSSWMIGDRDRDLIPAKKIGLGTIQVGRDVEGNNKLADHVCTDLWQASNFLLKKKL